jgi:peroxiredoxin Q/BCP
LTVCDPFTIPQEGADGIVGIFAAHCKPGTQIRLHQTLFDLLLQLGVGNISVVAIVQIIAFLGAKISFNQRFHSFILAVIAGNSPGIPNASTLKRLFFIGKKIVLYFYSKDNTPGCTRQACAFAGAYEEFQKRGVEVIGISRDGIASHVKFAEKYGLPFVLLSDPELEAIQSYGVWQEKKMYGKVSFGVVRTTFIIDENGIIEKIMPKVKPDTNAAEILEFL